MTALETVNNFISAYEATDLTKTESIISDEFKLNIPLPIPVGKMQLVGFLRVFKTALPDTTFILENPTEEGDTVKAGLKVKGTHTKDFAFPGFPPIPATGKLLELPSVQVVFTVKEDKITELKGDNFPMLNPQEIMGKLGLNFPGM